MDLQEFIKMKEFDQIESDLKEVKTQLRNNSFNLFTISSVNSYLENYHSDIISLLLNPKEKHNHKTDFLFLFIDYLNDFGFQIDKAKYESAEVTREKGRIDIWIKDINSKRCIIVENKINNASDQEKQLETYYSFAINSGYYVDCIVYLSLNSNKNAPITDNEKLNEKVLNVSAFTDKKSDLINGWLFKCYSISKTEDSSSFINQYIKLLKHLSQVGIDRKVKDEFYKILDSQISFERIQTIVELTNGLLEYRANIFFESIENDYFPFKKIYRYRPNHWFFERYDVEDNSFKLDVYFLADGSARIDFWNPNKEESVQKLTTSEKLRSAELIDEFEYGGFGGGMFKIFKHDISNNIIEVDKKASEFVRLLFKRLRTT